MNKTEKLAQLRALQTKIDALRRELGIASPGEIVYQDDLAVTSDDKVLVEADGFGGATARVVGGNYPLDYNTKFEKHFLSQSEAEDTAEQMASGGYEPPRSL